jgi:hypothetical protein
VLARLARVLIAVALLAAWQAALVHPLEHVDAAGGFVHLDGDADGHPEKTELCDALAALTACATHTVFSYTAVAPREPSAFPPRHARRIAEPPPFLSQGPPRLL